MVTTVPETVSRRNVRRTYACLLELADPAGRDPLTARALTKRWVGAEYGGWPTDVTDHWDPAPQVRVGWRVVEHHGDVAFEPHVAGAKDRGEPTPPDLGVEAVAPGQPVPNARHLPRVADARPRPSVRHPRRRSELAPARQV